MTTIAYRNGILAADTGVYSNGFCEARVSKIRKLTTGIVGSSGNAAHFQAFWIWINAGCTEQYVPKLDKEDSFDGVYIQLSSSGPEITIYDRFMVGISVHSTEFYALGTGREIAMGAMAMGAAPAEAIRIACRFDTHSIEPIETVSLSEDQ